jgi:hypothetical protein
MPFPRSLLFLLLLTVCSLPLWGEETRAGAKRVLESPSPDGRFGFSYRGEEDEKKSYELIEKKSGKVVQLIAESDPEAGPSARFHMEVRWRPDAKAFALTATFWKRGSTVAIYVREGAVFREVRLPELLAEIPEAVKAGKAYPHITELNSQSATRWQKGGTLVVEIENAQDGSEGSIVARRTVVLDFSKPGEARVVKSTIKFAVEPP